MARYIDADKLEKGFPQSVSKHNVIINGNEYPVFLVDHVLHKIRNYPAADVQEVRHAKFELVQNGKGVCSNCHRLDSIDDLAKYCRYCGACIVENATDTNVGSRKESDTDE